MRTIILSRTQSRTAGATVSLEWLRLFKPTVELIETFSINYNPVTKVFRVKVMPTEIHNCHVHWLKNELGDMVANGFLTLNEYKSLDFNVGTS